MNQYVLSDLGGELCTLRGDSAKAALETWMGSANWHIARAWPGPDLDGEERDWPIHEFEVVVIDEDADDVERVVYTLTKGA